MPPLERRSAAALRLWRTGPAGQEALRRDLTETLGEDGAAQACAAFDHLLSRLAEVARRPLRLAPLPSREASADEAAFGRVVALAAAGEVGAAAWLMVWLTDAAIPLEMVKDAERFGLLVASAAADAAPGLPRPGPDILD